MKKLIAWLLAAACMFCTVPAYAAPSEIGLLSAMGVFPREITDASAETMFTRAQLAYAAAHLAFGDSIMNTDTAISDAEEHIYSKEIKTVVAFGIMSKDLSDAFRPEATVSISELGRVLVDIMGYGDPAKTSGGYPNGYMAFAQRLGILKGVKGSAGDAITVATAARMLYNAATAKIDERVSMSGAENISFSSKAQEVSLMGRNLGVSVYTGEITRVNTQTNTATVTIESNKYETNDILLEKGSEHVFKSISVNLNPYEHVPATIWVDRKKEIVAIAPLNNVELKYGYLYSVNGDTNESSSYAIAAVNRLSLYGETVEYSVSKAVQLTYNEEMSAAPQKLVGNFMKLVIRDQEVVYMEGWDLEEGGILQECNDQEMKFLQKDAGTRSIKELDTIDRRLVFINNAGADWKDLRKDSYVRYFMQGSTLVLVAYEKVITETLDAWSNKELTIGGTTYETESAGWYLSTDGKQYRISNTNDIKAFCDTDVSAYFNGKDKIVYLCPALGQELQTNKFLAMLIGYKRASGMREPEMKLLPLEPIGESRVYTASKKLKLEDDLTEAELMETAGDIDGNGIYEFELNRKGEVTSIARPLPISGFQSVAANISAFTADVAYVALNNRNVLFTNEKMVGIYKDDDGFTAQNVTFNSINARNATNVVVRLYGYEDTPDIRLAVICGETENIFYNTLLEGFLSGKTLTVDADGELYYKVSVIGNGGENDYRVEYEEGQELPENALVSYRNRNLFGPANRIEFTSVTELPKTNNLAGIGGLVEATVRKVNSTAVTFEDGTTWFFHPSLFVLTEVTNIRGERICQPMKIEDLAPGDVVYYKQNFFMMQMIVMHY